MSDVVVACMPCEFVRSTVMNKGRSVFVVTQLKQGAYVCNFNGWL